MSSSTINVFKSVLVLLFSLSIHHTNCQTIVVCQNQTDYHTLLFKICERSLPCSRLYYIDPILDTNNLTDTNIMNLHDFVRFSHQMERISIFDVYYNGSTLDNPIGIAVAREKLLSKMIPIEWASEIKIIFSPSLAESERCGGTYDLSSANGNKIFFHSVLNALQTFKLFISEEFACSDPNEKLHLTDEGEFICICKKGKSCNNESNFANILEIVMISVAITVFMWAVSNIFSTFSIQNQIDALKKQK